MAELLQVLQCAYRSEEVVDIYKQVRHGLEDILKFYVSPGVRQRMSQRLDYAAFGELCNDFDMQVSVSKHWVLCVFWLVPARMKLAQLVNFGCILI